MESCRTDVDTSDHMRPSPAATVESARRHRTNNYSVARSPREAEERVSVTDQHVLGVTARLADEDEWLTDKAWLAYGRPHNIYYYMSAPVFGSHGNLTRTRAKRQTATRPLNGVGGGSRRRRRPLLPRPEAMNNSCSIVPMAIV